MKPIALKQGYRTPFVRMDAEFAKLNAVDLSTALVDSMLSKLDFPSDLIQHVVWGMVVPDPNIYSIARELVLGSKLNNHTEAYSVSRACATSLQATTNAALYYQGFSSEKSVTLVGGVESFSQTRPILTQAASRYFKGLAGRGTPLQKLIHALQIPITKLLPVPPSAKEYSTGLTMGQHCELMVKEFKIARERQDQFALASHQHAAKARASVASCLIPIGKATRDTIIRDNTSMSQLAKLRPAFDRTSGSVTAGNASPFTDGAAGLFLVSPALERDVKPDAKLIDFEYVGFSPDDGLLMGPGKAMLRVLERHRLKWKDFDYIDIHEAFAGQVLCNVDAVNDPAYRKSKYGIDYDAGELEETTLNPWGSSISYGHPFGATGARQLIHAIAYLKQHTKKRALVSACTAGALAGACILERV